MYFAMAILGVLIGLLFGALIVGMHTGMEIEALRRRADEAENSAKHWRNSYYETHKAYTKLQSLAIEGGAFLGWVKANDLIYYEAYIAGRKAKERILK